MFFTSRGFFFGSGDDDANDNGKGGKKGEPKKNKDTEKSSKGPQVVEIVQPGDNSEDMGDEDTGAGAMVKADIVPSIPHVIGLPVTRRPLFPGLVLPMAVTDPEIVAGLQQSMNSGQPYVGIFLRKEGQVQDEQEDFTGSFTGSDYYCCCCYYCCC